MSDYRHETAIVDENAKIGDETRIWQYCVIMKNAEIGSHCNIGAYVFVESDVKVGNGVKVKNNVSLYKGVELEDDVFVGPNVVFTNVINPRSFIERKAEFKATVVKRGASIGANATIVCGNSIGEYALVGAGAVVTKDVPPHALVMGNPARIRGYVCECGEKLHKAEESYVCARCGKQFVL